MRARTPRVTGCLVMASAATAGCMALAAKPAAAAEFGLASVAAKAKRLSQKSFTKPTAVPNKLQKLSLNQWQSIRFRKQSTFWRGGNFHVRLRPAGFLYNYPVKIHVVDAQGVHRVHFSRKLFDYDKKKLGTELPKGLGFAGFQVFYPLDRVHAGPSKVKNHQSKNGQPKHNPKEPDNEVLSFLGASYFRARAAGQVLGLSARGVAVNTATNAGEEFPYFRQFWLARPPRDGHALIIYALLDSPSITGAYRFAFHPGAPTRMDVQVVLYPRTKIEKLGLAPLTSMYLYGEGRDSPPPDHLYPAVHNSDGLLLHARNGRWIWRPVSDPETLADSEFYVQSPRGFGLMQRDRRSSHYPFLPMPYSRRPSAWVQPRGDWGKGHVELVEIPSHSKNNDNIVAFWVPHKPPPAHKPLRLSYSLYWQGQKLPPSPGRVVSTRSNTTSSKKTTRRFALDFSGGDLRKLQSTTQVDTIINADDNAVITNSQLQKDELTGTWRLIFSVRSKNGKPVQLRAYLARGKKQLTETWDYVMPGS